MVFQNAFHKTFRFHLLLVSIFIVPCHLFYILFILPIFHHNCLLLLLLLSLLLLSLVSDWFPPFFSYFFLFFLSVFILALYKKKPPFFVLSCLLPSWMEESFFVLILDFTFDFKNKKHKEKKRKFKTRVFKNQFSFPKMMIKYPWNSKAVSVFHVSLE